jgi:hypothetical protein
MSDDLPQSKLLRALKGQVDEFILQLDLGVHEAIDFVERHKGDVRETIDRALAALGDGESTRKLRQKLDEFRLQLALGRMETRDACESQRANIQRAVEEVRQEWHLLDADLREQLAEKSDSLQTKLHALGLELGLGAIIAEEDLKLRKDELAIQARNLAEKLDHAGGHAAEFAGEVRDAWAELKDRLRNLPG